MMRRMTSPSDNNARPAYTTHDVPGFGHYRSANDLYAAALRTPRADLLARVLENVEQDRTRAYRLRKADLAAMVAEWDTGARDLETAAYWSNARTAAPAAVVVTLDDDTASALVAFLSEMAAGPGYVRRDGCDEAARLLAAIRQGVTR